MARLEDIRAAGSHKTVEILRNNPNIVRATFRGPEYHQAYATYLLSKLANIFFPEAMPRTLDFGKDDTGRYYMDIERVPLDALHLALQAQINMPAAERAKLAAEHNSHELDYYKYVRGEKSDTLMSTSASFKDAGLPFDSHPYNWTFAENRILNVDFKSAWIDPDNRSGRHFNPEKIRAKIATLDVEKEKREASAILAELLALEK